MREKLPPPPMNLVSVGVHYNLFEMHSLWLMQEVHENCDYYLINK